MSQAKKYDVIVVGGGNAAAACAMSAFENGARVLMLEASPKSERGGNSRYSGAVFRYVIESSLQSLHLAHSTLLVSAAPLGWESIKALLCEGESSLPLPVFSRQITLILTYFPKDALKETENLTMDAYPTDQFTKDLLATSEGRADRAEVALLVEESYPTLAWMAKLGHPFTTILG